MDKKEYRNKLVEFSNEADRLNRLITDFQSSNDVSDLNDEKRDEYFDLISQFQTCGIERMEFCTKWRYNLSN